jgi:hypothetical protein
LIGDRLTMCIGDVRPAEFGSAGALVELEPV